MSLATVTKVNTLVPGSIERELAVQFNALLDELRVWATRLDAETLADSDYVARLDAAVSKIGDLSGTAIT